MGGNDPEREIDGVIRAILAYLRARPAATDSPRGILEWWLAGHEPMPHPLLVHEALEVLEQAGRVRRIVNPDGTVLFTAGPRIDADIEADDAP